MDRLTARHETFDHLGGAKLLVVEMEEHSLTLKNGLDLQVPRLDPTVLRERDHDRSRP
ncbi:hypothetical protein ACFU6S_00775 [Streptomyces sp. NPDC057456]|uniref:hypothetical protein n=1 Tax=Streptomyces sp. NPDC057456 TaxID=3346139 RepID=UPI00368C43BD